MADINILEKLHLLAHDIYGFNTRRFIFDSGQNEFDFGLYEYFRTGKNDRYDQIRKCSPVRYSYIVHNSLISINVWLIIRTYYSDRLCSFPIFVLLFHLKYYFYCHYILHPY